MRQPTSRGSGVLPSVSLKKPPQFTLLLPFYTQHHSRYCQFLILLACSYRDRSLPATSSSLAVPLAHPLGITFSHHRNGWKYYAQPYNADEAVRNSLLLSPDLHVICPHVGLAASSMLLTHQLVARLEAATSRLEDIAQTATQDPQDPQDSQHGVPAVAVSTATELPPSAAKSPLIPVHVPAALPPAIEAFDALINNEVKRFANLSDSIGGLVAEQVMPYYISLPERRLIYPLGCFGSSNIRCGAQVPHRDDQGQEAGYCLVIVHGDIERATGNNRPSQ